MQEQESITDDSVPTPSLPTAPWETPTLVKLDISGGTLNGLNINPDGGGSS